jgi:site-specific DNA-methyltransferase (adenine-specific)
MKEIPDNSIDLIVTDCPYKIVAGGVTIEERKDEAKGILRKRTISDGSACSNKWLKKNLDDVPCAVRSGKMFKHNDIAFSDWLPDVYRILKHDSHCYIMINGRNLKELWIEAEKVSFKFVNLLAWRKNNRTPNKYYMQQLEFILLLRKGKARKINNMGTSNCLDIPNIIGNKKHPTEKPVELMKIFIENSSNEGDVVLDPFMGSCPTGEACLSTNRNFIGMELDENYFNVSKNRIEMTQGVVC